MNSQFNINLSNISDRIFNERKGRTLERKGQNELMRELGKICVRWGVTGNGEI
jgi:hypothetical protein